MTITPEQSNTIPPWTGERPDPLDALFVPQFPEEARFWIVVTPQGEFEPRTLGADRAHAIIRHDHLNTTKFDATQGWQCIPVWLIKRKHTRSTGEWNAPAWVGEEGDSELLMAKQETEALRKAVVAAANILSAALKARQ